jgi:SAM-dependent methyltransferase
MDENTYLKTVFGGLDPDGFTPEANRKHAKYINDVIRFMSKRTKIRYNSILDAPCGYGRLEKLLRKYGYAITGVDINRYFIAEARRTDKSHSANYINQDMRFLHLNKKFDVILQWCASFGYYDDAENLAILKNFSEHMNKGGILFLDFPNREWHLNHTVPRRWDARDLPHALKLANTKIEWHGRKPFMTFTIKVYKKRGKNLLLKMTGSPGSIRLYTKKEMIELLKKAGFSLKYDFSSRTFQKPKRSESRSILICVKK